MYEKNDSKHLVELDDYLKTGSHIGTKFKTGDMKRYIFKQRKDGLKVLDVETIDSRIKIAAKFLAGYDPKGIIVVARKTYGQEPAKQFAEAVGGKAGGVATDVHHALSQGEGHVDAGLVHVLDQR